MAHAIVIEGEHFPCLSRCENSQNQAAVPEAGSQPHDAVHNREVQQARARSHLRAIDISIDSGN